MQTQALRFFKDLPKKEWRPSRDSHLRDSQKTDFHCKSLGLPHDSPQAQPLSWEQRHLLKAQGITG